MPQEPCMFYRSEDTYLHSKTIRADRSPRPPKKVRREWFEHPKSKYHRHAIGLGILCGGDEVSVSCEENKVSFLMFLASQSASPSPGTVPSS
jgi:hypothetical protein